MDKNYNDSKTLLNAWDRVCNFLCLSCPLSEFNNGFDRNCGEFAREYPEIFIKSIKKLEATIKI